MGFFDGLFGHGYKNPADEANKYLEQIPGKTQEYYQPWFEKGKGALNQTYDEYGNLINNAGGKLNQIGESYQQSPGLKFAIQQALQGAGHAQAAGGMAGSPEHEQYNMQLAANLGSQDYNNWMNNALGLYGSGLSGMQGISGMGQQAGQNMADMIAQTLAQQAQMKYAGQQNQNMANANKWNQIGNAIGGGASFGAFKPFQNMNMLGSGFGSNMYGGG